MSFFEWSQGRSAAYRRSTLSRTARMTFGAALILSTIALVSANSASASGPSGVLTVGIEGAGTSLNPAVDVAAGDQLVMQALPYESLIHYATLGTPSPGLAT